MKPSFRWYGEDDAISLKKIAQIPGMRSIVSAVYDVKPGQLWPEECVIKIKQACLKNNLIFDVVESIPVHEEIKLGGQNRDHLIDVYCENIRLVAKHGVKCICYNFMPIFDWTRTKLDKISDDGSTSLVLYHDQLDNLNPLVDDINLPGWDSSYSKDQIKELIIRYQQLKEEGLWENLTYFLQRVIPVAVEEKVIMAIHPDDPPYSIFGIPRIITNENNIDRLLKIVDVENNALTFCTGSLGCTKNNDVIKMIDKYSKMKRIGFMHIRNVLVLDDDSFEETAHLSSYGSLDMFAIVKTLVNNDFDGWVRPDHGRMVWDEIGRPGYGLYDRAMGMTYINGLFEACTNYKRGQHE